MPVWWTALRSLIRPSLEVGEQRRKGASHDNLQHDAQIRGRRVEAEPGTHNLRYRLPCGFAQPLRDGHGPGVLAGFVLHGDRRGASAAVGAEGSRPAVEATPGTTTRARDG